MKNFVLLFSLIGILTSCEKECIESLSEATIMRVNHHRQSCQGEGEFSCYLVQTGKQVGTTNWSLFYSQIEGFAFEEGFVYTLKVRIEKAPNPLADASDRKYILIEILSKEEA